MRRAFFLFAALLVLASPVRAQDLGFDSWLADFARDAQTAGISPETLGRVLPNLSFDESVIDLDRKQPESRVSFASYARGVLIPSRLQQARQLMDDYAPELARASAQYGAPPSLIVALWAIESNFGRNMGNYGILNSLATLAYEGRRADFFRKELIEALRIVEEEKINPDEMEGSWAGAMGQCQFMPSTFRAYAVDFDGDGRRNIWSDDVDAIGSIANYIRAEGWERGQRWGREVRPTRAVPASLVGLEVRRPLSFWRARGLRELNGKSLPNQSLTASLIQPDGPGGRSFLVYDNFRALMRWNRSTYFAASVGLLADEIDGGR